MTIKANCHCGAVKLEVPNLPEKFLECNCSTCGRYGAKWAYYPPEDVKVITEPDGTQAYIWGDKDLAFHHCKNCGCMTHYTTTEKYDKPKVALNGRMLTDRKQLDSIPSRHFDGRETWTFVEE